MKAMLVDIVNLLNEGNLAGAEQEVRQLIADASPNVPINALIVLAEIHRQKRGIRSSDWDHPPYTESTRNDY